jgi:hypothetical protein
MVFYHSSTAYYPPPDLRSGPVFIAYVSPLLLQLYTLKHRVNVAIQGLLWKLLMHASAERFVMAIGIALVIHLMNYLGSCISQLLQSFGDA